MPVPAAEFPRDAGDGLPLLLRVSAGRRRRNPHQHDTRGLLELGELSVDAVDGVLDEIIGAERRQHADSGASRPPFRNDVAHPFRDYSARRSEMISPTNPR